MHILAYEKSNNLTIFLLLNIQVASQLFLLFVKDQLCVYILSEYFLFFFFLSILFSQCYFQKPVTRSKSVLVYIGIHHSVICGLMCQKKHPYSQTSWYVQLFYLQPQRSTHFCHKEEEILLLIKLLQQPLVSRPE